MRCQEEKTGALGEVVAIYILKECALLGDGLRGAAPAAVDDFVGEAAHGECEHDGPRFGREALPSQPYQCQEGKEEHRFLHAKHP